MSDIETLQNMVTGLKQRQVNLRLEESAFLKMSGINEEIEKANQSKQGYEDELTAFKSVRDAAKAKKAAAISETTAKIEQKMNKILPSGRAIFSYDEDDEGKRKMLIGWSVDKKTTPYNGLSGGQKQIFDAALSNVLDTNIIVVEAAELDNDNLIKTLEQLSKLDKQVIVNTCHPIKGDIPEPFKIIEV